MFFLHKQGIQHDIYVLNIGNEDLLLYAIIECGSYSMHVVFLIILTHYISTNHLKL